MGFSRILDSFDRVLGFVSRGFGVVGAVWIGVLMLLITFDVLSRAMFNSPVTGTSEIARNSVAGIVFLLIPYAMRTGSHVRSEVVLSRVPEILQQTLRVLSNFLGFLLFALLIWASWTLMVRSWTIGEFEGLGALEVPVYPIRTIIVVASVLMCIECLNSMLRNFRGKIQQASDRAA